MRRRMNRNIGTQHGVKSGGTRFRARCAPFAVLIGVLLAGVSIAGPAAAQSRGNVGQAHIAVPPVMAVHTVSAPHEIAREQGRINASSDVVVDANTRYMLRVRLAHEPAHDVRVLVRDTAGVFQPLLSDGAVVVAIEQQRGRTAHTISCRIEGPDAARIEAGACALTYDWFTIDGGLRILSVSGG